MKKAHKEFLRHRRSIELRRLINIGSGADSLENWLFPPNVPEASLSDDDRMWMARFLDLKDLIERFHLPAANRRNGVLHKNSSLRLEDLWRLTQLVEGPELDWLRQICCVWAEILNVDLTSPEKAQSQKMPATDDIEHWMRGRINECKDAGTQLNRRDLWKSACEKFSQKIPQTTTNALKKKIAPEWSRPGPKRKNSANK